MIKENDFRVRRVRPIIVGKTAARPMRGGVHGKER